MNFIKDCFEEHGRVLMDELIGAGFTANQAIDFLPEAAFDIAESTRSTVVAQSIDNLLLDSSFILLNTINLEAIEKKSGLNSQQVVSGFEVIAPFFLKSFLNRK